MLVEFIRESHIQAEELEHLPIHRIRLVVGADHSPNPGHIPYAHIVHRACDQLPQVTEREVIGDAVQINDPDAAGSHLAVRPSIVLVNETPMRLSHCRHADILGGMQPFQRIPRLSLEFIDDAEQLLARREFIVGVGNIAEPPDLGNNFS